jgi:hypothetical protein
MTTFIECYNEQPAGMLRLSIVAGAVFDYGHQVARLDKFVEHFHRGEAEENEPFDALLKSIKLK